MQAHRLQLPRRRYLVGNFYLDLCGISTCLNTAYVSRGWFDAALVVFNGPGVPAEIKRIFTMCPWEGDGMVNNRSAQAACTPFILQLQDLCAQHPDTTYLRECLTDLGLSAMHSNDTEYWCCELRQMRHGKQQSHYKVSQANVNDVQGVMCPSQRQCSAIARPGKG